MKVSIDRDATALRTEPVPNGHNSPPLHVIEPLPAMAPVLSRLRERRMRIRFASFTLTQALRLRILRQGETSLWLCP